MSKISAILFTMLIAVSLFCGCSRDKQAPPPPVLSEKKVFTSFSFKASLNEGLQEDVAGAIGEDTIRIQALSGVSLSAMAPDFTFEGKKVTVDSVPQVSGQTRHDFNQPVKYVITAENSSVKTYVVVVGAEIPVFNISTNNVPIDSKEVYVDGTLSITGNVPAAFSYNGKIRIRGRGNATWGMPKKPYKIKLDKKAPLFGITSDKTWILLANYGDKSMMRNETAFELSRRLELAFTPKAYYVELMLNNEYQGTYQLTEQIEVAAHKVNVEEQEKGATALPQIAGGYLLEVDGYAGSEPAHFYTPKNMPITIHYPDAADLSTAQTNYINSYVNDFETALFAANFADPVNGYRRFLDVPSFINYYLVNEIIGNPDMFWSTYLYKKRDGKLCAGPVWDFDLAGNNDRRLGDAVNKMMRDAAHEPKAWINRLMEDATFRLAIRQRWNSVKADKIKTIPEYVTALSRKLMVTQQKNFQRWDILSTLVHLNLQAAGTYQGEVDFLKGYLEQRIAWLDTQINSNRFD
jgi:hypothetical protein